jgi:hypothetical protein
MVAALDGGVGVFAGVVTVCVHVTLNPHRAI